MDFWNRFTTKRWRWDGGSDLEGTINATSLEEMPGGVDKKVCFDVETGTFTGYGTNEECAG